MKSIYTMVIASLMVVSSAHADTKAESAPESPKVSAETKSVGPSAVAAADKRGKATIIRMASQNEAPEAPRAEADPTLVMGKFPTMATTKIEAKTDAGKQKEVSAPNAAAVRVSDVAPPSLVRAIAGLRPKLQACVAKPKGTIVMNVSVSDQGQLDAVIAQGSLEAEESACVIHTIQGAKVRGARGTSSALQLPL